MTNVTPLTRPALSSLEIVRKGDGIALMRGGEVECVITKDDLPKVGLACAVALSGR